MARNRQRAKARKAKGREKAQNAATQEALGAELRSTTEPPDPVSEASGPAEVAKAAGLTNSEPVEMGDDLIDESELEAEAVADASDRAAGASGSGEALPKRGNRFINFLRACWAELQRVQWPDRRQVGQATGVVLGFVVVAGAFLGLADFVASEIINLIL